MFTDVSIHVAGMLKKRRACPRLVDDVRGVVREWLKLAREKSGEINERRIDRGNLGQCDCNGNCLLFDRGGFSVGDFLAGNLGECGVEDW